MADFLGMLQVAARIAWIELALPRLAREALGRAQQSGQPTQIFAEGDSDFAVHPDGQIVANLSPDPAYGLTAMSPLFIAAAAVLEQSIVITSRDDAASTFEYRVICTSASTPASLVAERDAQRPPAE